MMEATSRPESRPPRVRARTRPDRLLRRTTSHPGALGGGRRALRGPHLRPTSALEGAAEFIDVVLPEALRCCWRYVLSLLVGVVENPDDADLIFGEGGILPWQTERILALLGTGGNAESE